MQDNGTFWEKNPIRLICLYVILKSEKAACNIMNLPNILNTGKISIFLRYIFSAIIKGGLHRCNKIFPL